MGSLTLCLRRPWPETRVFPAGPRCFPASKTFKAIFYLFIYFFNVSKGQRHRESPHKHGEGRQANYSCLPAPVCPRLSIRLPAHCLFFCTFGKVRCSSGNEHTDTQSRITLTVFIRWSVRLCSFGCIDTPITNRQTQASKSLFRAFFVDFLN